MNTSINNYLNLRLLFLSDHLGYADGVTHGATTYFLNILPSLAHAGIKVHTCFLRGRHPAAEQLEAANIYPFFLSRKKWDPYALFDLIQIIRTNDINIVHASGMKGIILGRLASRLCGCRAIAHLHDTNSPRYVLRLLHLATAHWTDICITVSDAVAQVAKAKFGMNDANTVTLYNGLALDAVSDPPPGTRRRIRNELALPHDAPVVAVIGRLSPEKGHTVLLRAMPKLLSTHSDAHLLIVGDGPTRSTCEEIACKLNMEENIRFAGHRHDVADVLAAIDVLAIPSYREGLSYCAIEAMAVGCPVTAFAVGGIPEVISHEDTGLLVEPGNADALVRSIQRLIDDTDLVHQLTHKARISVTRFSIDSHARRLLALYQHILAQSERTTHRTHDVRFRRAMCQHGPRSGDDSNVDRY